MLTKPKARGNKKQNNFLYLSDFIKGLKINEKDQ